MRRTITTAIVSGAALLAILVQPFLLPQDAGAVTAADWQAGNIIDDAVFTNTSAMTVSQIQSWLDTRLQNCDYYGTKPSELSGGIDYDKNGVVTRAEYGRTMGNPAPFTCLNDYYEVPKTTPSSTLPANNYGTSTIPSGAKSAAQLIYDAAQAYNISPKVLLVKLGTESAGPLTSDPWPFERQYLYAMGAHCPDSGVGGSANCDTDYAGFSLQIREAAKLLRWYLDSMTESWWPYKKPYATNYILWNVKPTGCGGSNVYIKSKATAALYTYTPYQPNAAALNNLYGTGNGCSAYGNRNFWRVYNDWFGSTHYSVIGAIGTKYASFGGSDGILGDPLMNEWCKLSQSGCYQRFDGGSIYWTQTTGAWVVRAGIRTTWGTVGAQDGYLGYPTSDETSLTNGTYQQFQGGRIYWSSTTGAQPVHGGILSRYLALGADTGKLGYPTSGEKLTTGGVYQDFQGGRIYWSPGIGAQVTLGAIKTRYILLNGNRGFLGFPISEETPTATGSYQKFEFGRIYWSATTGAHPVHGAIVSHYASLTDPITEFGYPTDGEQSITNGVYQPFQNGEIYWSYSAYGVTGSIRAAYATFGGATGRLGYPSGSKVISNDGVSQRFQNGDIYIPADGEPIIVHGGIRERYLTREGGPAVLGYPIGQETTIAGGVYQDFKNGSIFWSATTGAYVVSGDILARYRVAQTSLGYPVTKIGTASGGLYQLFQHGRIYSPSTGGAFMIRGGILGKYLQLGGGGGELGFPTSEELSGVNDITHSVYTYQTFADSTVEIRWEDGEANIVEAS